MRNFNLKRSFAIILFIGNPFFLSGGLFRSYHPKIIQPKRSYLEEINGPCDTSTFQMIYGGNGNDQIVDIISIDDDDALGVGRSSSTVNGDYDAWILKVNKTGNVIWSKIYGESGDDLFKRVISTNDGGLLAGGQTRAPSHPNGAALTVKTDKNGNVIWSFILNIPYTFIQAMWQTSDGGYALLATIDQLGPTSRIIVIKLDSNGKKQWMKQYYSSISDYGDCLKQTLDGELLITGFTHSFGVSHDCQIMKVSIKDGKLLWLKTFGSWGDDVIDWVVEDKKGNLFLSTQWNGNAALFKTDLNGNIIWGKSYNWQGHNGRGYNIKLTSDNNIVWGISDENNNGAILKLKTDGAIIWEKSYQVPKAEINMEYPVDELQSQTGYYIGGYTNAAGQGNDGYLIKTDLLGNTAGCNLVIPSFSVTSIQATETERTWTVENSDGWQPIELKAKLLKTNKKVICPQCCVSSNITVDTAVCEGTTYVLPNGDPVKKSGTYTTSFTTTSGCDSVITTHLTINPSYNQTVYDTIRQPEELILPDGQKAGATGTYISNLQTFTGCDSIITIHLTVKPEYFITSYDTICGNNSFTLPDGQQTDKAGLYTTSLKSVSGSDSIISTHLSVNPSYHLTVYDSICKNETYTLPDGKIVSSAGTYISNLHTSRGCDSLITTHLSLKGYVYTAIQKSICEGESFSLPDGTTIWKAGIYQVILSSQTSCDTLATYNISVMAAPKIKLPEDTCLVTGQNLLLSVQKGYPKYIWSTGSTADSLKVFVPGLYWVSALNECGMSADTIRVSDACLPVIFIPSAFTPNGDGINDVFRVLNVHGQKLISFDIYDRWGERVYHSSDISQGWNGIFRNRPANLGAYVYLIQLISPVNRYKMYKGTVLLIR